MKQLFAIIWLVFAVPAVTLAQELPTSTAATESPSTASDATANQLLTEAVGDLIKACRSMKSDLDRLACYDKASGRTPVITESKAAKGIWKVQVEKSEMTDQTNVYLQVESEKAVNCGWNKNQPIALIIRCRENRTSMIINTGCHMTSSRYNDYGHVSYRIDKRKSRKVSMEESTNNRSLGLWSGRRSIPVIKTLMGASQMIVRMTPYGENPFTAKFNIAGLEQTIRPLRDACRW